jgi:hypothetical protein
METLFPHLVRKSEFYTNASDADFYLVPHDSTCFYHTCVFEHGGDPESCKRDTGDYLSDILYQVINNYPNWNLSGGTDHVLVFSWDQASEVVGWDHSVRSVIQNAIHLTTLGSVKVNHNFNPHKDIVIPPFLNLSRAYRMFPDVKVTMSQILLSYVQLLLPYQMSTGDRWPNNRRRIWGYFRKFLRLIKGGTILDDFRYSFGVRQALLRLKSSGTRHKLMIEQGHSALYLQELGDSIFSLCPSGWSTWSPRIYESIYAASIPVLFADGIKLPFETDISYREFIVKINNDNVDQMEGILMSFGEEKLNQMRKNMLKIRHHLKWNNPPKNNDALYMTMRQLERKISKHKPIGFDQF